VRNWAGPTGQPTCQLLPSSAAVTAAELATNLPAVLAEVGLGVVGVGVGAGGEAAGADGDGVTAAVAEADSDADDDAVVAAAAAGLATGAVDKAGRDGVRLGEPAATLPFPWRQPARTTAASAATITVRFGAIAPG
jgi:hypothetical protein